MIGREVGNYRIVDRIGDGGMGSVYRAVDRMLDREVAIKVLRADLARKEALVERFRQEARALARLSHPRIATLHGLEQHDNELLMIMEFVRGDTLEAIVERSGRITWPRACELCIAVLDALDHAHDMGVVHRDIKPANIMLSHHGAVKVMDFGIARMLGRSRQTQVGHAVGTPMYMAPEQLRGQEVDGRTDLYAVGAVLFELIAGRMAFDADSDYALMMMKLNDPPPPVSAFVPEVPAAVDAIVFRAMANEPSQRFPNAMAFSQELTRALDAAPTSARATAGRRSAPAPETRVAVEPAPTEANASPGLAETRVAYNPPHEPHLPAEATGHATGKPRWTDWRVYASAGALFAAVALGVRLTRATPSPAVEWPVDSTVVTLLPPPPLPTPTLRAGEDIESLRVPPSSGLIAPPAAPPVAVPAPRPVPPPTADTRGNRDLPPPTRGRSSVEDHERAAPPPSALSRLSDTPQEAVAPTPAASAPAESAAQIREAIRSAVNAALSELARTAGAESLLHGDGREAWLALAREGRVSAGAPQALDIAWEGSQATAAFSSDVQVRSPFGANRRHAAQFTAQLQRDGARWRVISLRPAGKLSLK